MSPLSHLLKQQLSCRALPGHAFCGFNDSAKLWITSMPLYRWRNWSADKQSNSWSPNSRGSKIDIPHAWLQRQLFSPFIPTLGLLRAGSARCWVHEAKCFDPDPQTEACLQLKRRVEEEPNPRPPRLHPTCVRTTGARSQGGRFRGVGESRRLRGPQT